MRGKGLFTSSSKSGFTTFVEARGPGRNAPEASAGFPLSYEEPRSFPPEEAGGLFPAPPAKKSAPYDSNPAEAGPDPRARDSLSPYAPPLFKELNCYEGWDVEGWDVDAYVALLLTVFRWFGTLLLCRGKPD